LSSRYWTRYWGLRDGSSEAAAAAAAAAATGDWRLRLRASLAKMQREWARGVATLTVAEKGLSQVVAPLVRALSSHLAEHVDDAISRAEMELLANAARALRLVGAYLGWKWVFGTLVTDDLYPAMGDPAMGIERTNHRLHAMAVLFGELGQVR
jgi:hypothetical protein